MSIALIPDSQLELTSEHVHVAFSEPRRILSSAVLNGGLVEASHIVNLKVPKQIASPRAPEQSLADYCLQSGWYGPCVGMMTAALMDSFRLAQDTVQGVDVAVLVTSGLSNARRVGDLAEYRQMSAAPEKAGTINIIVLTSACLTDAAMVEVLMMVTEAKSAVLQEAGVLSPVSRKIATGTGTDSVAVVSGKGCEQVNFAGKHVLFGEVLGRLVVQALSSAVTWELENGSNVS